MRIRLIADDEPATPARLGESTFSVRRIPTAKRREIEAKRRREFARAARAGDLEASAACMQAIDDDIIDYALTAWEGLAGNPPCTRENKIRLPESAKAVVRAMADNVTVSGEDEGNFVSPSASASPSATGSATA